MLTDGISIIVFVIFEISVSHSGVAEDSRLLRCGACTLGAKSLRDLYVQTVIYWWLYLGCFCRERNLQHINFRENIRVCFSTTL